MKNRPKISQSAKGGSSEDVNPTVRSVLETIEDILRCIGDEYSDAAANMPDNLQGSSRHESMESAGGAITQMADELESIISELDDFDNLDEDEEQTAQTKAKLSEAHVKVSKLLNTASKQKRFGRCSQIVGEVIKQVEGQWPDFAARLDEVDFSGGCL